MATRSVNKMYRVIQNDNLEEFREEIEESINEGWELQGGVSTLNLDDVNNNPNSLLPVILYVQALKFN